MKLTENEKREAIKLIEAALAQFDWEVLRCEISMLPYMAVGVYFK